MLQHACARSTYIGGFGGKVIQTTIIHSYIIHNYKIIHKCV